MFGTRRESNHLLFGLHSRSVEHRAVYMVGKDVPVCAGEIKCRKTMYKNFEKRY